MAAELHLTLLPQVLHLKSLLPHPILKPPKIIENVLEINPFMTIHAHVYLVNHYFLTALGKVFTALGKEFASRRKKLPPKGHPVNTLI